MKRILFTTFAACLLALSAWANGTEIDGIHYELNSSTGTASVTYTGSNFSSGNNYLGDIIIPATVTYGGTTYSVTSIGNYAFYGCTGLTSIDIPNSVTSIGQSAFDGCTGLTSITIPNSVTIIGSSAFYGCTGLTSITIPNSVTSIGFYAFGDCSGLTSIDIPNSVTSIGDFAFSGCTGLTSIKVETGNTKYDSRDNCNAIIETATNTLIAGCNATTIPNSVTSIGNEAFYGCTGLTSITIPNSVTSIGDYAFGDCTGLTSINIPNSVTTIGQYAFDGCKGLTSINIPNSVTSIGDYAFSYCTGLTSIILNWDNPANCTYGSSMLYGVPTSATLYVPVGTKALYEHTAPWSQFENIVEREGTEINGIYYELDSSAKTASVTYTGTGTNYNPSSTAYTGSITIPATVTYGGTTYSVTSIGFYAFGDCSGLTSITIPNSVTSIGNNAFYRCTGLTSITIPNSVTSIGNSAFSLCSGLTSITIPNSVTSIDMYAFSDCTGLTRIKVAAGNTKYDSRDNCNAIIETATNTLIAGCKATNIPNSVTSIGMSAFYRCTGLTSITIPNSVTSIGDLAFEDCTGLTSINIPNSVTSIGGWVFIGCTGLTSIKVETGNTKYDSRDNCNAIIETATNTLIAGCKASTIPNSVTSIGGLAFSWCSGLTSVTIPNSVTSIGGEAFEGCTGLTSINIPNSVTTIGYHAFDYCTGLTSITIPNSVTSIGQYAFHNCSGLTSITLSWDDPTNCTYGSSMLDGVPTSATLYVPAGTKALYKNTEPWSQFENIEEKESVITLSNTMGTYCDASGLDFSSVEGLEAYTATGYASGEVTLTRVNYVPANTGIVLRGTAGVYEVPKQKVNAYLTNLLKGTTSPITLNQTEGDMTNYILANGSKGIGFYKVASGGGTLAANKAYLQLPSNLSATRPMMLRFEDEDGQTTDIQYLYTSDDDETAPAIFDLQGRRVSGTMQQGGIYIVGGKKVMAK